MTLTSKDIVFSAGSHRYHIAGTKPKEYIPSVTTICGLMDKPFLVEWAAREAATEAALAVAGEDKLDERTVLACIEVGRKKPRELRTHGADVGTAVHDRIKMMIVEGWEPEVEDGEEWNDGGIEADLAMDAFINWWREAYEGGWRVEFCERIVVHPSGLYVGTPDLLLQRDGERMLVDFKTSNQSEDNPLAIYPEYFFQVAAYRRAIMDSPEYEASAIDRAQILALGKNGALGITELSVDDLEEYFSAFTSLASVLPFYRKAQRDIRALNKVEKERRASEVEKV